MLQGTTAHYLAISTYPIQQGDTVIVHAAAGGVGLLLTQIAKRRGGRVIATTSTDEKAELARGAGADETIGYEGFGERARELTGGEGVHAVYDGIGATTFDESLSALRPRGYMVLYGAASGPPPPVEIAKLNAKSLFLTRPTLAHYGADGRGAADARRRPARVDRGGRARRPHRRSLPARGRGPRAGRPRIARHDGEADPHAVRLARRGAVGDLRRRADRAGGARDAASLADPRSRSRRSRARSRPVSGARAATSGCRSASPRAGSGCRTSR